MGDDIIGLTNWLIVCQLPKQLACNWNNSSVDCVAIQVKYVFIIKS